MFDTKISRRATLKGLAGAAAAGIMMPYVARAQSAVTLRIWTFLDPVNGKSPREQVLKQLISNFEAANPGVTIQVELQNWQTMAEKFSAAHQTGTAPDIPWVLMSRLRGVIGLGALANLDEVGEGWGKDDIADLDGAPFRLGATDTAHYQIPNSFGMQTQLARMDLFRAAGVDPASLQTWDGFLENVPKLVQKDASGNVTVWGFAQPNAGQTPLTPVVLSVLLDRDGNAFDENNKAKWLTQAGVDGLNLQADMIRKYKIMSEAQISMGNEDTIEAFHAGTVAIGRISTARWLQDQQKYGPGNIAVLQTPSYTAGKYSPTEITGWHLGVWSGSPNKEMAAKFVRYVASNEGDTLFSTVAGQPPIRQLTVTQNQAFFDDPANAVLSQISDGIRTLGWIAPDGAGSSGWNEGLSGAFQDMMTNGTDPKAALQKAEDAFNRMQR